MLRTVEKRDNPVNSGKLNAKQDFLCQDEDVTKTSVDNTETKNWQSEQDQNQLTQHCKNDP